MAIGNNYRRQVALLVRVLPFVADEKCFALKGGTGINLFVRDLPRLSVDIDLTYVPVKTRKASLKDINDALQRISSNLQNMSPGYQVLETRLQGEDAVIKLVVRDESVQIKIEVTPVLRGCVYAPELKSVSPNVEEQFGFAEIQMVSFADLYAGKIMAALDRQHPRDLFDVRGLLSNEGIDEKLRCAFIVYLLSHNRPMAEVLAPTRKDITQEFERGFKGMTERPISVEELVETREQIIKEIVGNMPSAHREMLLSFKRMDPDWSLIEVDGADKLPAIKWRMQNLAKLDEKKRQKLYGDLRRVLEGG